MGLSDEEALSSIRFSVGKDTSKEDIETATALLESACSDLSLH